MITKKMSGDL